MPRIPKFFSQSKNLLLFLVVALFAVIFIVLQPEGGNSPEKITLPELNKLIEKEKVEKVTLSETSVFVELKGEEKTYKTLDNPNDPSFKRDLMEKGVIVEESYPSPIFQIFAEIFIYVVIFAIFITVISKLLGKHLTSRKTDITEMTKAKTANTRLATFNDIAGVDEAKNELWEVIEFLKTPSRFLSMGIRPPKGVMLYGPPGTGKTLLARAVAGEAGVPFYSLSGSDFVEMFVGVGASRVRNLFEKARKTAPCVIFIDEIDAVAKKRGGTNSSNDERNQTLNALLVEMDGANNNSGIIIIGATNRLDTLDSALLRAGRFDKQVQVSYPDPQGRHEILRIHSKNKPLDSTVDLKRLAKRTAGFTGADLENLMNESAWSAIRNKRKRIIWDDVDAGFERIIAGPKKSRNTMNDEEKRIVAFHESGHAIVTKAMANLPIEKITIYPSGNALGYVMRTPQDRNLRSKKQLFNDICISLGGRVAEQFILGEENVTNGASQDFKQATQTAYEMVFSYGMSELGNISIDGESQDMWLRLSDDIKNKAFNEVQSILEEAKKVTTTFIKEHEDMLKRLAYKLLEVETIDGEDLDSVLYPETENNENIVTLTNDLNVRSGLAYNNVVLNRE